jgi:hypothetical protein
VDWLGGRAHWYDAVVTLLAGFLLALWLLRGRLDPDRKLWRWAMFGVGVAATGAFLIGGFVRSRSRSPYTVYQQIEKPEALDWERGRFLVHDHCLNCHPTLDDFEDYQAREWSARVEIERKRPGAHITDREAELVVHFLEKRFP